MTSYKGRTAEYLFASECSRRGLVYCFPSMEAIPYDAIVVNKLGVPHKVQVKSSFKEQQDTSLQIDIRRPHVQLPYEASAYDFLILYVDWRKDFYIIPHADILGRKFITVNKSYDKYKDNWEIFL